MSEFFVESEDFTEEQIARLEAALTDVAEADVPLSVELLLVDEAEIQRLNREQRGIDRVTDVLSFPSMEGIRALPLRAEEHGDELDEEDRLFLGSIVICSKRAREQAQEYGHSYERELGYLAVHGVLHCLGHDHETEEEKQEMRRREEAILRKMDLSRET